LLKNVNRFVFYTFPDKKIAIYVLYEVFWLFLYFFMLQ